MQASLRSQSEHLFQHLFRGLRGNEQNFRFRGNFANSPEGFNTTQPGEVNVHQNQVRPQFAGFLHSLHSVRRFANDLEPAPSPQHPADSLAVLLEVINDEYFYRFHDAKQESQLPANTRRLRLGRKFGRGENEVNEKWKPHARQYSVSCQNELQAYPVTG